MAVDEKYLPDVEAILSHRNDHEGNLWTTPDKRLFKGAPFSALDSALLLLELGIAPSDPLLKEVAELFFDAWQPDGRFKVYPKGSIFPCHTIHTAHLLCRMGYASDARLQQTLRHLLDTRYTDGGWRCEKYFFGRGPETEHSNPYPTLIALDAFRLSGLADTDPTLEQAVDFLLSHWDTKAPIGPCHYGIGTLFMQVEYPFRSYNLFVYVYVLSFYPTARRDPRFLEALAALESRLVNGQVVVQRVVPKLAKLQFCQKGQSSELATRRYHEIRENMNREEQA